MSAKRPIYLTWLNPLGGFDYWIFTAKHDYDIDVLESGETTANTFANWPNSYGEGSDTVTKQTYRRSRQQILIRSQYITRDQAEVLKHIRTSPLVQMLTDRHDRRTVLVDDNSFTVYREEDKQYSTSFTITFTDEIPSQKI